MVSVTLVLKLQNIHKQPVTSVAFNPISGTDTQQIASASQDSTIVLTNRIIGGKKDDCTSYRFHGHQDTVTAVAFSNAGLLASASKDMTISLWTPRLVGKNVTFRAHSSAVHDIAFSADGNQLVSGARDKALKLWQVRTRQFVTSFTGHNNWVSSVAFTPHNDHLLLSASDDKTIRLWDTRCQNHRCQHVYLTPAAVTRASFHSNGQTIAAALASGAVRLYDHRNNSKLLQHYDLHDIATDLCWHPTWDYLLSCGADGNVILVDVMEGRPLYKIKAHEGAVNCVKFDGTGGYFALGGDDKRITVWKCEECSGDSL